MRYKGLEDLFRPSEDVFHAMVQLHFRITNANDSAADKNDSAVKQQLSNVILLVLLFQKIEGVVVFCI